MTCYPILTALLLLTVRCQAQRSHFFQHEGFESCTPCNRTTQLQNCGPFITRAGTPRIVFSDCNEGVPANPAGVQPPKEGKAYGGFSALSSLKTSADYRGEKYIFLNREYMAFRLVTALVKQARYQVVFYISLAEKSSFAAPAMSVCVSPELPKRLQKFSHTLKEESATYKLDVAAVLSDSTNWQRVAFSFVATGGEQYVTIGVFARDISRKAYNKINIDSAIKPLGAYYYVDDITVEGL